MYAPIGYSFYHRTPANYQFYSYRYDVKEDGTFENRKLFAFVNSGAPDGKLRCFLMIFPESC